MEDGLEDCFVGYPCKHWFALEGKVKGRRVWLRGEEQNCKPKVSDSSCYYF